MLSSFFFKKRSSWVTNINVFPPIAAQYNLDQEMQNLDDNSNDEIIILATAAPPSNMTVASKVLSYTFDVNSLLY